LNEKKVAIKHTVHHTAKKIVKVVCADKEGHHLRKCHDKVKTAVKHHFHVIKKETKKAFKNCACSVKATNYCSASATENAVIEKCVVVYVKTCAVQCLKRSHHFVHRHQRLAEQLCKHSNSANCAQVITEHAGKGVTKVHNHLVKVHILKKVGVSKKQVRHAIENKKIVIVEHENEKLHKKLIKEEEENKELELRLLKKEQKKVEKIEFERKEQLKNEKLHKKLIKEEEENKELELKLLKEEQENKELEIKLSKEEQEKKEYKHRLHSDEKTKHKLIKKELHEHSQKCACESATTAEEKKKCHAACQSRQVILKKKVTDYVDETSTSCQVKASLACGHLKTKEECKQCKKGFIVLCIEEETKRKNELVAILEKCDDN